MKTVEVEGVVVEVFAANLRQVRLTKGWSQGDLANRLNWKAPLVSHYECARREPGITNIMKLCKALDVTPNRLLLPAERARAAKEVVDDS